MMKHTAREERLPPPVPLALSRDVLVAVPGTPRRDAGQLK